MVERVEFEWTLKVRRFDKDGIEDGKPETWGSTVSLHNTLDSGAWLNAARLIGLQITETITSMIYPNRPPGPGIERI